MPVSDDVQVTPLTGASLIEQMLGAPVAATPTTQLISGTFQALPERKLTAATCQLYGYSVATHRGRPHQVADYRGQDGWVVAQHLRSPSKEFSWIGRQKGLTIQLFGQHLGSKGNLVICEGEIDAMSVHQVLSGQRIIGLPGQWTVVSIPDGAASAAKNIQQHLAWVEGFDKVYLFFDQDEPGRAAAQKAIDLVAKAVICDRFPYKDANEALVKDDGKAIIDALSNARRPAPANMIVATSLLEEVLNPVNRFGQPLPWHGWNKLTQGLKPGELWLLSAGTGLGKSHFFRVIALDLLLQGQPVAYYPLEEAPVTTVERMLSLVLGTDPAFHLDSPEQRAQRDPQEIRRAMDSFAPRLFLSDKFGGDSFDAFVSSVKHHVLNESCRYVFLDHFSFLADGIALTSDQRRAIDKCIKDLKKLAISLQFTLLVISHLSRGDGLNPHEEGGEPHLGQLRGSHSLAQVPDYIVMLQRNPRAEDPREQHITNCWLKKNRVSGELGLMSRLLYLPSSRLIEVA